MLKARYRRKQYTNGIAIIVALLGLIGSIAAGVYVGVWLLFINAGVIGFIEAVKQPVIDSGAIGWSIFNMIIASPAGWLTAVIGLFITGVIASIFE